MAEQEFQILVSTHDFLQLQSRYQELQLLNKKLIDERTQINTQMLQLTVQNTSMQKKISKLNDHITYLSKQGFKMAEKLIKRDINQQNIQKSQKQYQQLTQSIKTQAQISYKKLLQEMKLAELSHNKQKAELQNKITITIQKMQQNQQNSSKQRNLLQKQKQQLNYNNKQLNQRINKMKMQLDQLSTRYDEQNKKVSKLEGNIKQMKSQNNESKCVNQYISQQLQSKLKLESEIQEKEKQLICFRDRINGQNLQIINLTKETKQLKQKLKQQSQKARSYEKILKDIQRQQKPEKIFKKKEITTKQNLKELIQEYFSICKINMIEAGLTSRQITQILKSQQQPIIKYIQDSINFMISQEKIQMEKQSHEKKKKKMFNS